MNSERYHRVKELFTCLSELPAEQWDGYLAEHCDDEHIRTQVKELLKHDQNPIELPEPVIAREALEDAWEGQAPFPDVPGFEVKRLLGEGGMGEVYLAEQEFPRRLVALKLVRGARFSAQALRRFREEIQLLGRLHHPAITQVYAADSAQSKPGVRPYFAMEYVQGLPLIEYARKNRCSDRALVELMIRIAEAVHYAHEQGIIHRDLKPANVLVENSGRPKVLDFGIARAVGDDFETRTLLTASEHVVGTMGYMAPEQFRGLTSQVGPQVDVYALGVMLFELLTGELPHALTGLNLFEAGHRITESEPTRISTLQRMHRGDLNTIVCKALQRDPAERFATAQELADDLQRYLAGDPIQARTPSITYRGRKFLQRHRVPLVMMATALVVGVSGMAWYGPPLVVPQVPAFDWSYQDFLQGEEEEFQLLGAGRDCRFGSSIAAPGDLTGDGVTDFLIGAPIEMVDGEPVGTISAFDGATGAMLHKLHGSVPLAKFGHALVPADDLDGDGVADFWTLTGSTEHPDDGALFAYSGKTWNIIHHVLGSDLGYRMRRRIANVGDLTGDGISDLALVCDETQAGEVPISPGSIEADDFAPSGTRKLRPPGLVVLLDGKDCSIFRIIDTKVPMLTQVHRVANAGDVNADGTPDLIIGTFLAARQLPGEGRATVYSGTDGAILHQWDGGIEQIRFGFAVACAGDIDLDGHDDVMVSAIYAGFTGVKTGRVYLYSGKDGHLIRDLDGFFSNARFGSDICSLGDINGDGVPDQAIGAWVATNARVHAGAVYVHDGKDGHLIGSWYGDRENARLGFPLHAIGDLDGDGMPELAAGAANNMKLDVEAGSVRLIASRAFSEQQ